MIVSTHEATRNLHGHLSVEFDRAYRYYAIRNDGPFDIYASAAIPNCMPYVDGVVTVPKMTSLVLAANTPKIYFRGAGAVSIIGSDDKFNPFITQLLPGNDQLRECVRGEEKTFYLTFSMMKDGVYKRFIPSDTDRIVFSVWGQVYHDEEFIEKEFTLSDFNEQGQLVLTLTQENTSWLLPGDYHTDIILYSDTWAEPVNLSPTNGKLRVFNPSSKEDKPEEPTSDPNNG